MFLLPLARLKLTPLAGRGIEEANRSRAAGLHIRGRRLNPPLRSRLAVRSAKQSIVEQRSPDRSRNLHSRAALVQGRIRFLLFHNRGRHANARDAFLHVCGNTNSPSANVGRSLRNVRRTNPRSTNRQPRYAATARPLGGVTARESAATLEFESDTDACSQGQGGKKHNSEPDQYPAF